MVLRGIRHAGHVPTGTGIQAVGLTDHVDQLPVSPVAEGSIGAVDQAPGIVSVGKEAEGDVGAVEQGRAGARVHDQVGLPGTDGGARGKEIVPVIPLLGRRIGVVGSVGLVGERVEREAHRAIGRVVDLEVLVVGGPFRILTEEQVAGLTARAGSVVDVGAGHVVVGIGQGASIQEHIVLAARDELEVAEAVVQRSRHLELGIDDDLTGGLMIPAAVVDAEFTRAVVDAPLAVAKVRGGHRTGGLHQHAFPLFHVGGHRAEHLSGGQVIALADDAGDQRISAHTLNLGQSEVLGDDASQGHKVAHAHRHLGVESEHAAVGTGSFLQAEQGAVHPGHGSAHGHQGVGEHRRIQRLTLLDRRNGNGPIDHLTTVVVDDGGRVIVVGGRVGAPQLLEIVRVARLDAVAEAAVDGPRHAVGVAEHGALFRVAVVAHVVDVVGAGPVVDRELSEVVGFARDGARDLAEDPFVLFQVGVRRGEHGGCGQRVASVEDGGGGASQLGASIEGANDALHEDTVSHGHLGGVIEQAASNVHEHAAPGAFSILDGGVASVDTGHDAPDQNGLSVERSVVLGAHVLLDGADGHFGRVLAASVVKRGVGVVVDGRLVGASTDLDPIQHALGHEQGDVRGRLLLTGIVVKAIRGAGPITIDGPIRPVPRLAIRGGRGAEGVAVLELMARVGPVFPDHTEEVHNGPRGIVEGDLVVSIAVRGSSRPCDQVRSKSIRRLESRSGSRHVDATGVIEGAVRTEVKLGGAGGLEVSIGPPEQVPAGHVQVGPGVVGDLHKPRGCVVRGIGEHREVSGLGREGSGQQDREENGSKLPHSMSFHHVGIGALKLGRKAGQPPDSADV